MVHFDNLTDLLISIWQLVDVGSATTQPTHCGKMALVRQLWRGRGYSHFCLM